MTIVADVKLRDQSLAFNESRRLLPHRIAFTTSIAYAKGARHTLDVCRPKSATAAPVIVFFYGGGWRSGSKRTYRYVAKALARRGYVAVLPDYRIYPQARYPDFLDDGALAVRWVKDNVQRFGGDPQKIFLMGHSAGAHIAAMLAIDATWLQKVGLKPGRDILGLIGVSGPYDFLPLKDETLEIIFGGANRPETQPISHVTPGAPPALLLTGGKDDVVGAGNSTRLAEKSARRGQRGDGGDLSAHRALHHRRRDRAHHPVAGSDFARHRRLHCQGADVEPARAGWRAMTARDIPRRSSLPSASASRRS